MQGYITIVIKNIFNMTHEETIKELNNLIIYLNRYIADNEPPSNLVENVISKLRDLDVLGNVVRSIESFKIERPNTMSQYIMELQHLETDKRNKNRASIQSMIEILGKEQERHKRILDEEAQQTSIAEQREGNEIMRRTLRWSIVAAVASVIAAIISFIALVK